MKSSSTATGSSCTWPMKRSGYSPAAAHDWTKRFKKVADDAWHISAGSAIIDGEIVVPAADGTTDFSVLQNQLRGKSDKIVMVAFDLLYLNGYDLRKLPLIERKAHLKKLVAGTAIQFSESFEVDGAEMFAHACGIGLEGVVSKVRDSRYTSGRGNDWVKKTCAQRETLPIAGFALKENKFDGIYIGRLKGKDLVYAGKVDLGFDKTSAAELQARLETADPQDPALCQKDRAPGDLGRAAAAGRDRVPGEISRGQGAASVLQGPPGGSVMELPHWLILAGTILVLMGFLGLAFSRNSRAASGSGSEPSSPGAQVPPMPSLLDTSRRKNK